MDKNVNNKGFQWSNIHQIINLVPGSLIYRGNKIEPFMIEVISYNEENYTNDFYYTADELVTSTVLDNDESEMVIWINITGINHVEEINKIGTFFGIEQLILEQILNITKHSSFKITEDYLFNDLQMIYEVDDKINYENIGLLMLDRFILTFQEREGDVFDSVRDRIKHKIGRIRKSEQGYTYFCLLDALVDNYLNSIAIIGKHIEIMEETVTNLESLEMSAIHEVRKQLMVMKFSANPIDKLIQQFLAENTLGVQNIIYIESISNHIKEVQNELTIQKEMIDGIYENYILNNSNDMNKVMTILTIFSAVFIPLSFLAGVFGMNFEQIPGLTNPYGYYYFLGGCIITAVAMVSFFKLKKWF